MRGLLNILVLLGLIGLIALSWDKSLGERLSEIPLRGRYIAGESASAMPATRATRVAAHTRGEPAATPANGAWMWDPNHRTALDRPANQTHTFTNHIYYVDNNGAKYWLDAQGQRHYEP